MWAETHSLEWSGSKQRNRSSAENFRRAQQRASGTKSLSSGTSRPVGSSQGHNGQTVFRLLGLALLLSGVRGNNSLHAGLRGPAPDPLLCGVVFVAFTGEKERKQGPDGSFRRIYKQHPNAKMERNGGHHLGDLISDEVAGES